MLPCDGRDVNRWLVLSGNGVDWQKYSHGACAEAQGLGRSAPPRWLTQAPCRPCRRPHPDTSDRPTRLARAIFHGKRGELRQRARARKINASARSGRQSRRAQEHDLHGCRLNQRVAEGYDVKPDDVSRLSPLGFRQVNMPGRSPCRNSSREANSDRCETRKAPIRRPVQSLCRFSVPLLLRGRIAQNSGETPRPSLRRLEPGLGQPAESQASANRDISSARNVRIRDTRVNGTWSFGTA